MAGVLQFTLGLATGNFLTNAQRATGAITNLIKTTALVGAGFAGVKGLEGALAPLTRGAALDALSKRTGETVRNLFSMQEGFKAVNLSTESLGPMLFQLNKSLGGFNELGEPTKDVFAAIGLGVDELKSKQAPERVLALAKALNKFDDETGTNIASKIFGRGSAGDFLQLARGSGEFADALQRAAPAAEVMARNAAAFEKITSAFERLKNIGFNLFANLWEGAGPGLQSVLDALNNIDLSGFGKKLGQIIAVAFQAFREDQLGELIGLSLKSGIQDASNFMNEQIDQWALKMSAAMNPGSGSGFWSKVGAGTAGVGAGLLGLWNLVGEKLGVPGAGAKAEERIAQAEKLFGAAGLGGGLLSDIAGAGGSLNRSNPFKAELQKKFADLLSRVVFGTESPLAGGGGGGGLNPELLTRGVSGSQRRDVSAFERIGLGFFGERAGQDYNRQTASNTSQMAATLNRIEAKLHPTSYNDAVWANQ